MHEFPRFVYLDVEKTGSAFISTFLRRYSAEEQLRRDHHAAMEAGCDRSKFYFISTRDPLEAYLSLYSYGCDGKGKLFAVLKRQGRGGLYDGTMAGFVKWVDFVLKPKHAKLLGVDYPRASNGRVAELMGLQSFRFLKLAVAGPDTLLEGVGSEAELREIYDEYKLPSFVVRHESFVDDLCRLIEGPLRPHLRDIDGALNFVRTELPLNASDRIDAYETREKLKEKARAKVREREWLLCDLFGY